MPRSFDVSADSPATVEQVHWAFSDEGYWLARLASMNGGTAPETLGGDDDQTAAGRPPPGSGSRSAARDSREVLWPRSESPSHRDVETDRRPAPRPDRRCGVRGA